jgi:hypothetical protein
MSFFFLILTKSQAWKLSKYQTGPAFASPFNLVQACYRMLTYTCVPLLGTMQLVIQDYWLSSNIRVDCIR